MPHTHARHFKTKGIRIAHPRSENIIDNVASGWTYPAQALEEAGLDNTITSVVSIATASFTSATPVISITTVATSTASVSIPSITIAPVVQNPLFLNDTFTDTAGTNVVGHVANTGGTWASNTAFVPDSVPKISATGTAYASSGATNGLFYTSATPPSPNYSVEADLVVKSSLTQLVAVVARASTTQVTYIRMYHLSGTWGIQIVVNNVSTLIGTSAQTLTVGQTYRMKLRVEGTSVKAYVDNVEIISGTDSQITGAGKAGFYMGSAGSVAGTSTTGLHLDNLSGVVTPARASVVSPSVTISVTSQAIATASSISSTPKVTITSPVSQVSASVNSPTILNLKSIVVNAAESTASSPTLVPNISVEAGVASTIAIGNTSIPTISVETIALSVTDAPSPVPNLSWNISSANSMASVENPSIINVSVGLQGHINYYIWSRQSNAIIYVRNDELNESSRAMETLVI